MIKRRTASRLDLDSVDDVFISKCATGTPCIHANPRTAQVRVAGGRQDGGVSGIREGRRGELLPAEQRDGRGRGLRGALLAPALLPGAPARGVRARERDGLRGAVHDRRTCGRRTAAECRAPLPGAGRACASRQRLRHRVALQAVRWRVQARAEKEA